MEVVLSRLQGIIEFIYCFHFASYLGGKIIGRIWVIYMLWEPLCFDIHTHCTKSMLPGLLPRWLQCLPQGRDDTRTREHWRFAGSCIGKTNMSKFQQGFCQAAIAVNQPWIIWVIKYMSRLYWVFPGSPLSFDGAPGNIQGNLVTVGKSFYSTKNWWRNYCQTKQPQTLYDLLGILSLSIYSCLIGQLWYLKHICVGDTTVYH